jgi:hypothetical protein
VGWNSGINCILIAINGKRNILPRMISRYKCRPEIVSIPASKNSYLPANGDNEELSGGALRMRRDAVHWADPVLKVNVLTVRGGLPAMNRAVLGSIVLTYMTVRSGRHPEE